jgi:hypothetical protein
MRQAIIQWCLEFARRHYPGTLARPVDEASVAQLYCEGSIELPELSYLRPFLNPWTLVALCQGHLTSAGRKADAVATGSRSTAIAADGWRYLQPDFERSTASLDGKTIYGIEVEVARSTARRAPKSVAGHGRVLQWLSKKYVPNCEAAGPLPNRDVAYAAAQKEVPGFTDRPWFRKQWATYTKRGRGKPRKMARQNGS